MLSRGRKPIWRQCLNMKKTLLITLEYPPQVGGVAKYYHNLSLGLPKDSFDVLVFGANWKKAIIQTIIYARKNKIEEIWVGNVLPLGYAGLACKQILGIPYIVFGHGMDSAMPLHHPRKKKLAGMVYKHARLLIANTEFTKGNMEKYGVPSGKIKVLYPPIDVETFDGLYNSHATQKQMLLSVGRLIERKGFQFALEAFSRIAPAYPKAEYIIVGNGPYKAELEKKALSLGLSDRICFVGAISDKKELARYYNECTAFIMLSFEPSPGDVESFGMVYLEANLFGKPVVAARSGGVHEAVLNNRTGLIVLPENVEQAAGALHRLFGDQKFASMLGQNGRERVLKDFSIAHQVKRLQELF